MDPSAVATVSSGYPSASSILESVQSGSRSEIDAGGGGDMSLVSRPVVDEYSRDADDEDSKNPRIRHEVEPQHDQMDEVDEYEQGDYQEEEEDRLIDNVDVCVTAISSKAPTLPLREELPSLGVELVYNSKGTGMRGVRRAYRDAKRRPPPVPHASGGKKKTSGSGNGGLRKAVRQIRLGRRILRTSSSGSLQSVVSGGGGGPSSPTSTAIVSPPKKAAISYEAYHRTTLRSPGSSEASSFRDEQESIATHSTGACSEEDDASLGRIDEGTGLVPEQDADPHHHQQRQKKWKDTEAINPTLAGDGGPGDETGLSYNFNESSTSNLPVSAPTVVAAAAAIPPPTRTSDNVAPPIPPATPMQKIEQLSEALRNVCCFGYLNLDHKDAKSDKDENTAPLLGISPSQDSDMQELLDKMEEEKIPAGFLQNAGIGVGANPASADNITVVTEEIQEEEEEGPRYENELFALLAQYDARPEEAKELLNDRPELAGAILQGSGRMALHELCDRGLSLDPWVFLPDGDDDDDDDDEQPGNDNKQAGIDELNGQENGANARRLLDGLLGDVTNFRIMLKVVAWADVKACCTKDANSDLPLHIIARRLVEWEKSWNNDDMKYFCDPTDIFNSARITTLYRTMAECIEVVLRPVAEDRDLCLTGGSCNVLPLHTAALFGVSYDVLRILLEQAPMVAHMPCKVHNNLADHDDESHGGDLGSNSSESEILPLTLLEQREVEQTYGDPNVEPYVTTEANQPSNFSVGIQWSSSALESGPISNDFVRKSDLLFACNPNILPQRKESARLKRIESMVRSEVMQNYSAAGSYGEKKLSFAIESVWLFMCTFTNQVDEGDNYADNVRRIVEGLDSVSLLRLVAITDIEGRELLDVANPKCAAVIKDSLQEAVQNGSSSPHCTSPSSHASGCASPTPSQSSQKSILKKTKTDSPRASKDCKESQAASTMEICNEIGRLCKTVFRLKKDDVPTSFIILPYKMNEEANGQIALASSKDAGLAMKFAHSLVKLTDPRAILYALEKKFHERRGNLSDLTTALSSKQKEEIENDIVVFLSLYTSNIGYLYLLDERTGVPMIKNTCDGPSTYPIIISNAYATVDKLLPLMQMGMTLMRGEVALKVLGQVICLGANTVSPRSWVGVSRDIAKLMYSGQREMHLSEEEKEKLMNLRDKLGECVSAMSAKVQKEGLGFEDGSEWVVEMSFFRTVLEKFDGRRSYAGLKPIKHHGRVIWTRQVESSDQAGDVKIPGDYVEARYRYDAFIHTSINVHQEQGSEVSSMTSVFFEDSAETAGQSQPDDAENNIPAVIIQTLSAVCEEDMDEKDQSSGDDESRGDRAAATTKSEGDRVSPTNSNTHNDKDPQEIADTNPEAQQYTEITASNAEGVKGEEPSEKPLAVEDEATVTQADITGEGDDEYTEVTASSGESSSSHGTYSAVLETLGFDMYNNAQTDDAASTGQSNHQAKANATLSSTSPPSLDAEAQILPPEEILSLSESTPDEKQATPPKPAKSSSASTSSDMIIAAFIEETQTVIAGNGNNNEESLVSPSNTEYSSFCNATGRDFADSDNLASEADEYNYLSFDLSEGKEGEASRSALSLILDETNESFREKDEAEDSPTAEGEFSNFCALQARNRIAQGIDSYKKLHPGTQTIKFILMGGVRPDETNTESVDSGIVGLSILDEEEKPIDGEEVGTAEELLAFVSDSIQKEQEIKEKDVQINDMQRAMAAYDSMKEVEINEKEAAIRELTRTLRLYEEEFHSVASEPKSVNGGSVELSMAIRSTYDGNGGVLGTDEDVKHDIANKVRTGMKAHLYDLHHAHLSKDLEIEQLRLAFHMRETKIIREKNLEIASLHKQLAGKEIQIDEYERRIATLLESAPEEDDFTTSTGSISQR